MEYSPLGGKKEGEESDSQAEMDEDETKPDAQLLSALFKHGWDCVKSYWQGQGSIHYNQDLAEGVRQLVAKGVTTTAQLPDGNTQLRGDGGWKIHSPLLSRWLCCRHSRAATWDLHIIFLTNRLKSQE